MSQSLDTLLQKTGLWRASGVDYRFRRGISTGFQTLDEHLPGAGWPADGLTELLYDRHGIGEFRLIAPALARLSREQTRLILCVAPPFIPYPPALANAGIDLSAMVVVRTANRRDTLWALEKALASGSCSVVMGWPADIDSRQIRRLQVAGKEGNCWGILFRSHRAAMHASPAELRLQLCGATASPLLDDSCVKLKILKRRGGWHTDWFSLYFEDGLNRMSPDFSEMVVRDPAGHDRETGFIERPPDTGKALHGF